jgi:preprotein translocase subunit YajC
MSITDTARQVTREAESGAGSLFSSLKWEVAAFVMFLAKFLQRRKELGDSLAEAKFEGDTVAHRAGQVGTVIAVVVIGVVGLVGILIFAEVREALPTIENNNLSNSSDALADGFGGAMELLPVVLIVLVASVVIGVVQRLRA